MTREEAIKEIKSWDFLDGKEIEAIHTLIPELIESEDEKTRKEILNYVLYKADGVSEEDEHRWVTWLEKQKEPENVSASTMIPSCWEVEQEEQKPAWSKEDEVYLQDALWCVKQAAKVAKDENDMGTCWSAERFLKSLRLQSKREWSEEDEAFLKVAIAICNRYSHKDIADWLKSLSLNLKKKNEDVAKLCSHEWNEEDQKTLDCIINVLDRLGFEEYCKSSRDQDVEEERLYHKEIQCLKKLKSLRPQPKAELTLLDKNIIEAAVAFVEQNNHFSYWGGIDKHTVIKALRSLKPHWKPTEDQMKALKNISYGSYQNGDGPILRELYEQLEKLM